MQKQELQRAVWMAPRMGHTQECHDKGFRVPAQGVAEEVEGQCPRRRGELQSREGWGLRSGGCEFRDEVLAGETDVVLGRQRVSV